MFCDEVSIKVDGVPLRVRRMTIAEIRKARLAYRTRDDFAVDKEYTELLKSHVKTEDGSEFDPDTLSLPQTQRLVSELVGIPEGSGISDFIGLLS